MVLGSRYRAQGDFLGIGKALKKFGGFIPGVGGVVSKVGGFIEGVGGKPKMPVLPARPVAPTFALPGGSMVKVDSIKLGGRGVSIGPAGFQAGSGSATLFTSSGRRKKIRRINALNPKALSRSIRRIDKFQDFAKSVGFSRPPHRLKGIHAPKRKRRVACR